MLINTTQHNTTQHVDYVGQRLFVKQSSRLFTTFKLLKSRAFCIQNNIFVATRKTVA